MQVQFDAFTLDGGTRQLLRTGEEEMPPEPKAELRLGRGGLTVRVCVGTASIATDIEA